MTKPPPVDPWLELALRSLAVPGILIGHRLIAPGDEDALMPEELGPFSASVVAVRRASGAARIVARQLMVQLGHPRCAVPKAPSGAPVWPKGIVGSLSHDARVAVAAVAPRQDNVALGIDIEPAEPLPAEILELVATARERQRIADDPFDGRLLFAAKEAVYKAVYPLDQTFLDYHDIQISLADRKAVAPSGRAIDLRFCTSSHVVVLAFVPGSEGSKS